jgi:hypothetical protein
MSRSASRPGAVKCAQSSNTESRLVGLARSRIGTSPAGCGPDELPAKTAKVYRASSLVSEPSAPLGVEFFKAQPEPQGGEGAESGVVRVLCAAGDNLRVLGAVVFQPLLMPPCLGQVRRTHRRSIGGAHGVCLEDEFPAAWAVG